MPLRIYKVTYGDADGLTHETRVAASGPKEVKKKMVRALKIHEDQVLDIFRLGWFYGIANNPEVKII